MYIYMYFYYRNFYDEGSGPVCVFNPDFRDRCWLDYNKSMHRFCLFGQEIPFSFSGR